MTFLVLSLAVFMGGAMLCLLTAGHARLTRFVGPAVTVAGAIVGLVPAVQVLAGSGVLRVSAPWSMPFGSLTLQLDALSALFAIPILAISALAAIYGSGYLVSSEAKKDTAISWFMFNLLAGSMLAVVVARNGMLFLLAWEVMSLSSFFLVMFNGEEENVRRAGWTYLVATHVGTAFILILFALLGSGGNMDFDNFRAVASAPGMAGTAFLLALIGFGTKAGFVPLHVWLPEAHPAAPSHVSAVMSGVMIKTGIYGLLRMVTLIGPPQAWWGWVLLSVGAVSGILGILFALAQGDLKRMLAYSSVENIGIIALGLGIGILGLSHGNAAVAVLGLGGGLLHMVNHSVFKSLLFMSAGSVLHATGTRDIDHLGGLIKKMPVTGAAFLVGSVAICGLPPLNGFLGEFMIYVGSFRFVVGSSSWSVSTTAAGLLAIGSLGLIGGLAVACFTKAFGTIFLGEPRTEHAAHAHEAGLAMKLPMIVLALACVAIGFSGPFILQFLGRSAAVIAGATRADAVPMPMDALRMVLLATAAMTVLAALLALLRTRLLSGRDVTSSVTWDCGYARPTPRMQYTASSFAQPLMLVFKFLLGTHRHGTRPTGIFPAPSSFSHDTPDVYRERLYTPLFSSIERTLAWFRLIQHGRLNLYILCIVVALVALLVWRLG